MKNSSIQWTDHTFNPWEGCTKVAPECKNCYAETLVDTRFGRAKWGKGQPRRRTSPALWKQPLAWNREAGLCKCGQGIQASALHDCSSGRYSVPYFEKMRRARVFCLSLGDWLDEEVDTLWLADLLELIGATPNLDWLLLTKRPQNWFARMQRVSAFRFDKDRGIPHSSAPFVEAWLRGEPPPNVWIGVSAGADQRGALAIPAKIHFLSCEPMLRPLAVDMASTSSKFDWIIFGGESGKNARPCLIQWIRDGIAFCQGLGIACFIKQLGALPIVDMGPTGKFRTSNGRRQMQMQATPLELKDSHGGDWNEWPEDLRVREMPEVTNGQN